MKRFYLIGITFFFASFLASAQVIVVVKGVITDNETEESLPQTMIINSANGRGSFSDNSGSFIIKAHTVDTLIVSAIGYHFRKIPLVDFPAKDTININIMLTKLYFTLKEVTIYPTRSLDEIDKDIERLGTKMEYTTQGMDAIESPITYLYERFSKFSKSKQKVAMWENDDLKRELLKELFRLYIKYDIINLSDSEFDAFIKYLNLSDDFIKNASQLELVLAIKGKYESYKYRWK